jgi:hypothetical protein
MSHVFPKLSRQFVEIIRNLKRMSVSVGTPSRFEPLADLSSFDVRCWIAPG